MRRIKEMNFSTLENAKLRFQYYEFSADLLAMTILDNQDTYLIPISAYGLPSISEKEREEVSCYITEVIADYPSP